MAGHFIARGEVDGVVVGADRIAANGDTANKIGTYTLSVLAKEHGLPFYVAAPLSTVDLAVAERRRHPHRGARPRRGHALPRRCGWRRPGRTPVTRPSTSRRRPTSRAIITEVGRAAPALRPGAAPGLPRRAVRTDDRARRRAQGAHHGGRPGHAPGAAHRPHRQAHGARSSIARSWSTSCACWRRHGVTEVCVNLHHYADDIRGYFGDGARASACRPTTASKRSCWARPAAPAAFATCSATAPSSWSAATPSPTSTSRRFVAAHRARGAHRHDRRQRGRRPVALRRRGARRRRRACTGFQEKPATAEALSNLCNCGIYAFEPAIFDLIPPRRLRRLRQRRVSGAARRRRAVPRVAPRDLLERRRQHPRVPARQLRRPAGPRRRRRCPGRELRLGVWVGEGTEVADDVEIVPPVLIGDGCRVAAQRQARRPARHRRRLHHRPAAPCSRGSSTGTAPPPGAAPRWPAASSAAACASATTPSCTSGAVIGDGCDIADGAVVKADARLGSADRGGGRVRRARTARVTSLGRLADGAVDLFLPKRCVVLRARRPLALRRPARRRSCRCRPPSARAAGRRSRGRGAECRECRGRDLAFASARAAYRLRRSGAPAGDGLQVPRAAFARRPRWPASPQLAVRARPWRPSAAPRGVDLVTCVPVHRERDLERGFDQAALLGRRLAAAAGLPFALAARAQRAAGGGRADSAPPRAPPTCAKRSGSTTEWSIKRVE